MYTKFKVQANQAAAELLAQVESQSFFSIFKVLLKIQVSGEVVVSSFVQQISKIAVQILKCLTLVALSVYTKLQ